MSLEEGVSIHWPSVSEFKSWEGYTETPYSGSPRACFNRMVEFLEDIGYRIISCPFSMKRESWEDILSVDGRIYAVKSVGERREPLVSLPPHFTVIIFLLGLSILAVSVISGSLGGIIFGALWLMISTFLLLGWGFVTKTRTIVVYLSGEARRGSRERIVKEQEVERKAIEPYIFGELSIRIGGRTNIESERAAVRDDVRELLDKLERFIKVR